MKATWVTSAVAGALFATIISIFGSNKSELANLVFLAVFLVSSVVGVIGIGQLREINAERKRRGLGIFSMMAEKDDFARFYVPGWGRSLVWFLAAVCVAVTKALLS